MGKKFTESLANGADHVVGDILLGGIGRLGYHMGKLPVVGTVGAYVRDNVSDGFQAAARSELVSKALKGIREIQDKMKGVRLTAEQVKCMAVEAGVHPDDLEKVREAALKEVEEKPAQAVPALPKPGGPSLGVASA